MRLDSFPTLIALALAAISIGCQKAQPARPVAKDAPLQVTVAEVKQTPWERKLALVGALLPNQQARIAAEVEGSIEKTLIEVGDSVKDGAALAQIDTASYQGMVNMWTANMAKAQAKAENTTENLERLKQLQKTGAVATNEFDQAVAAQKEAAAELNATKAQLGAASTALRRSLAKAPFDGAITERLVNDGDFVRIGTVMFHIVDDSVLKFRGEIPEREAPRAKVGQTVRLSVEAFPGRTFEGKVSWINPAANPATRGVAIEARVENPQHELKANFFARAEIVTDTAAPTLTVPVESIVSFAGVTKVFVVENGVAAGREVALGSTRGEEQEILSGLKPGEHVVVSGRTKVQHGSKVAILPQPADAPKIAQP